MSPCDQERGAAGCCSLNLEGIDRAANDINTKTRPETSRARSSSSQRRIAQGVGMTASAVSVPAPPDAMLTPNTAPALVLCPSHSPFLPSGFFLFPPHPLLPPPLPPSLPISPKPFHGFPLPGWGCTVRYDAAGRDRVDGKVTLDPVHAVRFLWMGLASCGNVVGAILALQ